MAFYSDRLRITVLGSGTSMGVPTIGCHCDVCTSNDPRDNRLRPSILIRYGGRNVLIDTTPDFRTQALRAKINRLDAILFPAASGAAVAATPGYPTVIVPFGMVPNAPTPALPDGFNAKPAPYGVSFTGMACSEPRLLELAFGFEQATKRRVPLPSAP